MFLLKSFIVLFYFGFTYQLGSRVGWKNLFKPEHKITFLLLAVLNLCALTHLSMMWFPMDHIINTASNILLVAATAALVFTHQKDFLADLLKRKE